MQITQTNGRSCGTCDMCCTGTLGLPIIQGHIPERKKPCHFLNIETKCTIYADRPFVCKNYKCLWLADEAIPDFMKPENFGGVFDIGSFEGYQYLQLNKNYGPYPEEVLQFAKDEADKRNMNLIIQTDDIYSYYGDDEKCLQILRDQFGVAY
jgi:hypothetical protein